MDKMEMTKLLSGTSREELQILTAAKILMEDGRMGMDQAIAFAQRLSMLPTQVGFTTEEAAMLVCDMAEEFDIAGLEDASDAALGLYLDNEFLAWMVRIEEGREDPLPPAAEDGGAWVALVLQECTECGTVFPLQYEGTLSANKKSVIAGYQYLGKSCDCEYVDFSPKDGPSLVEWVEAIKEDGRLFPYYMESRRAIKECNDKAVDFVKF